MVGDSIADMLNRIKTASLVRKETVAIPYSNVTFAIAKTLEKGGYLLEVAKKGKKVTKIIEVRLPYVDNEAKIQGVERISKPGRRVYLGVREIKPIRNGFGVIVLSTPKGILTGDEARKERVGGEVLFKIW